ncbi:protein translocase subunit secE/sec61 gamma [Thalassoporum mexicanum PCC 7367]|uniref:preprotein translocase subunit SecE n=1 Tax=Thalassoporum mexicanum TaxID=3457544 RepID=UPI00029F9901|nr:preprotein translocase subunit SecE [Pseudanabaena sp. PCC 7367]AFY68652.1 protein translocase subunit secE/sec61 gamma [Pseudanabaena sp. PCC 7367]
MTKEEDLKKGKKPSQEEAAETGKAGKFIKNTQAELEKVVWPSRQQLFSESAAVLLMVVAASSLVYLVDGLFRWVANQLF